MRTADENVGVVWLEGYVSHPVPAQTHQISTKNKIESTVYSLEREGAYLCPLRVDRHDPEVMSHILMVLSLEPLTRMLGLSGLKATQLTPRLLKHTTSVLKKT